MLCVQMWKLTSDGNDPARGASSSELGDSSGVGPQSLSSSGLSSAMLRFTSSKPFPSDTSFVTLIPPRVEGDATVQALLRTAKAVDMLQLLYRRCHNVTAVDWKQDERACPIPPHDPNGNINSS